ncbi:SDR family NAD(P)-dependent oxidoreductase [Nocardioides speluncae]|uniref:SDR family NAD(P)-dependent oxidoreductase n=1 Tax=Nocardioides speluncae TaxID=2670337 RepID=UPI000D687FE4|nr:SDR family oxidoreductase [Nocardioides speluncae]
MTRLAVVTGGGTGIGRAIAERMASDGDRVVIVGRRADVLDEAAKEINAQVGADRVFTWPADVTSVADVTALADGLPDHVDVLVHNAGGSVTVDDESLAGTARRWIETYRLNVVSAVLLTEALLPRLTRPGGRIVAVSSVASLKGAGSYGAAKAAVNNWVTDLAGQLAPEGITVNAVAPGFVPETGFWDSRRTDALIADRVSKTPVGRPGTPAEIAALVAHLASAEAGFTTGQVVGIHGGMVLARL